MSRNNNRPEKLPPQILHGLESAAQREHAVKMHVTNLIQSTAVQIYAQMIAINAQFAEPDEDYEDHVLERHMLQDRMEVDPDYFRKTARYAVDAAPYIVEAMGMIQIAPNQHGHD